MRLARAIKQLLNLRLLVTYNETRSICAAVVLLRGQTAPRISDYFRE
jgi:hypothetical protein